MTLLILFQANGHGSEQKALKEHEMMVKMIYSFGGTRV